MLPGNGIGMEPRMPKTGVVQFSQLYFISEGQSNCMYYEGHLTKDGGVKKGLSSKIKKEYVRNYLLPVLLLWAKLNNI